MTAADRPRVIYLCLEALQAGQAAATHVRAIADGLNAAGLPTELVAVEMQPRKPHRSVLHRLRDYMGLTRQALGALRRADIAYVRAHPAALAFSLGARIMRKPVVHEINGRTADIGVSYRLPGWATRALTQLQHWQYRAAAALVAVTPGLGAWLQESVTNSVPIRIIPNGADSTLFRPDATGGPVIDADYILFFGGLVAWHGIDTMLAAIADPAWPSDVKLAIVGHGPGHAAVVEAARQNPGIVALGYLPKAELAGLAARALAFLCPIEQHGKRDEGGVAPLKLFEGMASGRPVIASDLPFQAQIIRQHECGIVFPAADSAALAAAAAEVANSRIAATEMGARGRKAVETLYDWRYRANDTAVLLSECYDMTLAARGR